MKAICEDELVIDCTEYKAIESGVILMGDEDRNDVIAFVPSEKLEYLLPDEVVEREYERLGLPAPDISSPEELESRLDEFATEIGELREQLDRQVEELIDEGATFDEENLERQERLRERRRTIDRLLQQVRQRGQQLSQLSAMGSETEAETETTTQEAGETAQATAEAGETSEDELGSLRAEMDARLEAIEAQLQELASGSESAGGEGTSEETSPDVDVIQGLGPTYASRLRDAGIETVQTLTERSPEEVAEAADVGEGRASTWIDQAKELLEEQQAA
jgi:predicted flap endonuclease-1-like 5' DNA nuclease